MAKKRHAHVMKKIEPAVQTVVLVTPGVDGGQTGSFTCDLSQIASLMNRRFYRQGIQWAVGGMKIISTTSSNIYVKKLPQTWVLSNAWEKSFRSWQRMIRNATDESGTESIKGKFLDFKIYADSQHHQDGFGSNLLPLDGSFGTYNVGQWQPSTFSIPTTTQQTPAVSDREIIAVGPNFPGVGNSGLNAVSMVQGYADSRALPVQQDPNVPADASTSWMVQLFSDGTEQDAEVIDNLEALGDNPPYPFEGDLLGNPDTMYPGGETQAPALELHDFEQITSTTVGGITHIKGGMFPCGLIRFDLENTSGDNNQPYAIQIDLVPGPHRGYLCSPMTEM